VVAASSIRELSHFEMKPGLAWRPPVGPYAAYEGRVRVGGGSRPHSQGSAPAWRELPRTLGAGRPSRHRRHPHEHGRDSGVNPGRNARYNTATQVTRAITGLRDRLGGCRGVLVDSNVLLDVATNDPMWSDWSASALAEAAERTILVVNPIIYAEVSVGYSTIEALDAAFSAASQLFPKSRDSRARKALGMGPYQIYSFAAFRFSYPSKTCTTRIFFNATGESWPIGI
jgi:hypothetical protein